MAWSESQLIALAIIPKFSSLLSIFGSTWIIVEVSRSKRKRSKTYHRLLFAMSVFDIIESLWNFCSTWPIPEGTEGVWNSLGNTATCEAQGFFLQLGLAIPLYNAALSFYYVFVIRYGMTEATLQRVVEPFMHTVTILLALGTASAGAGLDLYNSANLWCWIAPFPPDCKDSIRFGGEAPCERGDNAWIYRWIFYFGPLWFAIISCIFTMLVVYFTVLNREAKTATYRRPDETGRIARATRTQPEMNRMQRIHARFAAVFGLNPMSREVMSQAFWYLFAFCMVHFFSTLNRILQQVTHKDWYGMIVLHSFFDPLQGFFNFLVYRRPQYLKLRVKHRSVGRLTAMRQTMRFSYVNSRQMRAQREAAFERKHNYSGSSSRDVMTEEAKEEKEESQVFGEDMSNGNGRFKDLIDDMSFTNHDGSVSGYLGGSSHQVPPPARIDEWEEDSNDDFDEQVKRMSVLLNDGLQLGGLFGSPKDREHKRGGAERRSVNPLRRAQMQLRFSSIDTRTTRQMEERGVKRSGSVRSSSSAPNPVGGILMKTPSLKKVCFAEDEEISDAESVS